MIATISMAGQNSYHLTKTEIDAELELIKAAQKDPRCFEPLYKGHYKRIVGFVYHRIESKEEAYEITAQVFYKALENLSKFKSRGVPFSAWLFRIAGNELNQRFRKNKNNRFVDLTEEGIQELDLGYDDFNSGQQDAQLYEALQKLDLDDMELIDMRYFEKRSFIEISLITGMNESACKMRVYRILEKLRTLLKKN